MTRKQHIIIAAGVALSLILLIVLALRLGRGSREKTAQTADAAAGRAFLQELETRDPEPVTAELKAIHQRRLEALRDERLRQLESGEISVWPLFEDYVILGDSRAVGFWFYDYLPEERVLAEGGGTIRTLAQHIPEIVALDPSNLFLCYGLNDVSIGYWETPEEYVAEYEQVISDIRAQLPDVNIYISSILPARDPAFDLEPLWREIPTFSAAVKEMCLQTGCFYVDNDTICAEHADLWNEDGIHVARAFYPYWAANLITEVYSSQLDWAGEEEE